MKILLRSFANMKFSFHLAMNSVILASGIGANYFVVPCSNSYFDARLQCSNAGGVLARISNLDENSEAFALIDQSSGAWIGLNDISQEGQFIWEADGSILTFSNWNPPNPNNDGNEDCVVMGPFVDKWADTPCQGVFGVNYLQAICQRFAFI
jgi:hypothetical protein